MWFHKAKYPSIYVLTVLSVSSFSALTIAHAKKGQLEQAASNQSKNTLILNQGPDQQVAAQSLKDARGNDAFQSKLKMPGVEIIEQVHQRDHGYSLQENKIIVNVAKNESVEFIQQFDSKGRRLSRSTVKQSATPSMGRVQPQKSVVASQGSRNNLAIEHQTSMVGNSRRTTTTIRSNNFSYVPSNKKWMLIASGGFARIADATSSDGSTGIARIALNRSLLQKNFFDLGLEVGILNGTNIRPVVQQDTLNALGGTPILATIKPAIELLPTITRTFSHGRFAAFAKLGIAYRSMTFDRDTIPNISKVSPDLHLGLTAQASDAIDLMVYYNAVLGGHPNLSSSMYPLPANNVGRVSNIPTQQAVLLGIAYRF